MKYLGAHIWAGLWALYVTVYVGFDNLQAMLLMEQIFIVGSLALPYLVYYANL